MPLVRCSILGCPLAHGQANFCSIAQPWRKGTSARNTASDHPKIARNAHDYPLSAVFPLYFYHFSAGCAQCCPPHLESQMSQGSGKGRRKRPIRSRLYKAQGKRAPWTDTQIVTDMKSRVVSPKTVMFPPEKYVPFFHQKPASFSLLPYWILCYSCCRAMAVSSRQSDDSPGG